jgi:hypothetical protein
VRIFSSKEEEQQHSRQKKLCRSSSSTASLLCQKKQPKNYDYKRKLEKDLFQLSIDFLLLQLLWVAYDGHGHNTEMKLT